jgi:hypothetical protein
MKSRSFAARKNSSSVIPARGLGRSTVHTSYSRDAGEELVRAQRQPFELFLRDLRHGLLLSSALSFAG